MSLGQNIKKLRGERKLTQEQVAEKMDVSFQAVSSWERDEYKPDTEKLIKLAGLFEISLSALVEDRGSAFEPKDTIYNWQHMKTYVKTTAKSLGLNNTLKAVDFAVKAHEGQTRKKCDTPYIYHPLNMACHALAMNINDDEVIAACLLHDVVEDCNVELTELPVSDEIREIVRLLTHGKTTKENRDKVMDLYYKEIKTNPKAVLVKCIDRCNNLTTMSWGLAKEKVYRMLRETEKYYPQLINKLKGEPEYNNAAWLLKYQMESMLEIYKRMI